MFFHCSPNIALSWNMSLVDPYSITTSVSHSWATSASCFAVWTTLPEGILWCTDPFTEPPIPSATLFLCEVAKKCHYFIQEFLLPKFKVQEKIRLPELRWWTIKQKNKLSLSCHNFSEQIVRWSRHTYVLPPCHDLSNQIQTLDLDFFVKP